MHSFRALWKAHYSCIPPQQGVVWPGRHPAARGRCWTTCQEGAAQQAPSSAATKTQPPAGPTISGGKKVRVERLLANLGYCTRKDAGKMIRSGRVTLLDGTPVIKPSEQVPPSVVLLDNQPLDPLPPFTIALHKPQGYTCSTADPQAGSLIYELLPSRFAARSPVLSSVGRLDKDTSGLLLMTDHGVLLHQITSPRKAMWKTYLVQAARPWTGDEPAIFGGGDLMLRGEQSPLTPARMVLLQDQKALISISEGRYHQVRRMVAAVGNHVEGLSRVAVGGLVLPQHSQQYENELVQLQVVPMNAWVSFEGLEQEGAWTSVQPYHLSAVFA